MAVWHVDFYLAPRRIVTATGASKGPLDATQWWATTPLPADFRARLDLVAPRATSPKSGLESWGRDDGNGIDIGIVEGQVRSAMVHVDVRRLDSRFGAMLLQFVQSIGAVLIRRDGLVVEPNINAYATALRSSSAWQYASDPAAHLASYTTPDDE